MIVYKINKTESIEYKKDDLVVFFNQKRAYEKATARKVNIALDGTINLENYFKDVTHNDDKKLKEIATRLVYIDSNCKKAVLTIHRGIKVTKSMKGTLYDKANIMKFIIDDMTQEQLENIMPTFNTNAFHIFLEISSELKGKKFIKLYKEYLQFLWNLATSLFESFLYYHITPQKGYKYTLNSYIFYFCVDFIKNITIDIDDVDENYNIKIKSVYVICRFFNHKIINLTDKKDFINYLKHDSKNYLV